MAQSDSFCFHNTNISRMQDETYIEMNPNILFLNFEMVQLLTDGLQVSLLGEPRQ